MQALLNAIQERWNASPELQTLAAGGLWVTQAPEEATLPLAVLVMADGTQTPNSQAYLYETPATITAVAANGDDAQQLGEAIADAYRDVELTITDGHWRASDQQGQPIPGSQQDTARELWLSTVQFNFGFAILR